MTDRCRFAQRERWQSHPSPPAPTRFKLALKGLKGPVGTLRSEPKGGRRPVDSVARAIRYPAQKMTFRLLLLSIVFLVPRLGAANPPIGRFGKVDVAPTTTSIYVGTVSMTMPSFLRHGTMYSAAYAAKVFPFFFENEKGTLTVEITDAQLDQLARGQPIEFTGRGVRDDGVERKVTGKATPRDATSGTLKVRVFVSKHIELIFNTTYRFAE